MRGHLDTDVQEGLDLGTLCSREQCLNRSATYNFNYLGIVNSDFNLYCKYSEQEYFSKLNIEKDYFEYEQNSAIVSLKVQKILERYCFKNYTVWVQNSFLIYSEKSLFYKQYICFA